MQTLANALRSDAGLGREIEIPFREINHAVDFRTGEIAVLAGAPGGGKSMVAVNWAWKAPYPVLYLAQDSKASILDRMTALALDLKTSTVRSMRQHAADKVEALEKRQELVISDGRHSIADIEARVIALTEWLGEPPHVIIVDNMYNLKAEEGYMDNKFYAELLPELLRLAQEQDVGVILLHHVIRSGDKGKKTGQGNQPIRLTDLLYAGERESTHVWGTWKNDYETQLNFAILKQRDGRANPGGDYRFLLDWQPEKALLMSRSDRRGFNQ